MSAKKIAGAVANADGRVDVLALGAARSPQVNLLPAEIRASRALGRVKRVLGAVLVGVGALAAAGFLGAFLLERSAADDLAKKQSEVQTLVAQQAKYAEVPQVKSQVAAAKAARKLGMSTEVLWSSYLAAIQTATPAGVTITSLATSLPSPVAPTTVAVAPLSAPGIGSVSFIGQARTLPDLSAWMEAIDGIPGFADATYVTATLTDNAGVAFYNISTTVQVNEIALASRFATEASK